MDKLGQEKHIPCLAVIGKMLSQNMLSNNIKILFSKIYFLIKIMLALFQGLSLDCSKKLVPIRVNMGTALIFIVHFYRFTTKRSMIYYK